MPDCLKANNFIDHEQVKVIANKCFQDSRHCNDALSQINIYQKNAAMNRNLSCQTRLLGLEANLVMARNYSLKKQEAKSIIDSLKKYC